MIPFKQNTTNGPGEVSQYDIPLRKCGMRRILYFSSQG